MSIDSPRTRAWLAVATLAALHPVLRWTALRAVDGSDEPFGILALLAALGLVIKQRRAAPVACRSVAACLRGPALWLLVYVATYRWLTPLPRGMLAMTALGLLLSRFYFGTKLSVGLLGLLQLGLPMLASLQFYLGYPLRVGVATATSHLLRLSGFDVKVVGVGLELGERTIMVDAPCSGIKMLWVGAFAACLIAVHRRFGLRQSLVLLGGTAFCLFSANVLRAAALFYVEFGLVTFSSATHEAVGLVMFAVALVMIAALSHFIRGVPSHA
jgi:exosortase/archaeosortase family protein